MFFYEFDLFLLIYVPPHIFVLDAMSFFSIFDLFLFNQWQGFLGFNFRVLIFGHPKNTNMSLTPPHFCLSLFLSCNVTSLIISITYSLISPLSPSLSGCRKLLGVQVYFSCYKIYKLIANCLQVTTPDDMLLAERILNINSGENVVLPIHL